MDRVYPRVCGVDQADIEDVMLCDGLSPRVRGRFEASILKYQTVRFIPACAG